ncbi:DUF4231 domain-containing protein [candidate division KSB1 bacterium]|nr:DUF4231 domain-containing protein [candidate division KSB1 bacterium]
MTPILVALDLTKSFIIIISAIVAIGTTVLKAFNYQEHWINYRTICETLRKEIYFYSSLSSEYKSTDDPKSLFIERIENLISQENTMYIS